MSESAEPTADSVEVEEKKEEQPEEQLQEQREELQEQQTGDFESSAVEVVESSGSEEVQEKEQENVQELEREEERGQEQEEELDREREVESEPTSEQDQEQEQEQRNELEQEKEEEEEPKKALEESRDTMQLPAANMSERAIEDEEMPSMVTLSSPSKIDESETNIKQDSEKRFVDVEGSSPKSSPEKVEDNDSDSVCVIDDDDDDEGEGDGSSYDDDDESSSYHDDYDDDSEEMDRDRYNDNYRRVRNVRRMEDDDEEDEDEEEEEYIDEDSEQYCFDGGSDDLVLRHSNGLTKQHKERSASLQDLSHFRERSPKQRHNVNPFSQKARLERNQVSLERRPQGKQYAHVESKVKKYIMDMSEQRRMSGERRKRAQEEARHKNQDAAEMQIRRNDQVVMSCKTIKDYTEKTLKEVAECEENEEMYVVPQSLGNGEISIFPRRSMGNGEPMIREEDDDEEMDVEPIEIDSHKSDEKVDKINGSVVNDNQNNYIPERKGIHRREEYSSKPVLNGEDPLSVNPVCDLRTLTYEEYMKGTVSKEISQEVVNDENVIELQSIPEKCNNNEAESDCILRIENVVSNYCSTDKVDDSFHDRKTPVMTVNQSTETYYQEDPEVSSLRLQLSQRNSQFDNLREAYQKTMSENLAMKMELENLKQMVSYYQVQQKPVVETKVIAVQTEAPVPAPSMPIIDIDNSEQQIDPRLATTSMISSQWSDSTGSAAISMEPPPNVTTALNSDESTSLPSKTPLKKNAFSRAFVTSTRILQTLSNITHGKGKSDKLGGKRSKIPVPEPATQSSTSGQSENVQSMETAPTNSKKRKATDLAEISGSAHPFKIPHTSKSERERGMRTSETEPEVINPDNENNVNNTGANTEKNDNENEDEVQEAGDDDDDDDDDDVKVFVYSEDEPGKEHSFLIQAKEVSSNSNKGVRECGPYLLGNVEVYMTEMNGTINIWGKEVSQGSAAQNIEELETSARSKDTKSGFRWQSTPRIFNNQSSASTSKKSRILPRFSQQQQQQHHHQQKRHSCDINNSTVECDSCHSNSHRVSWPSCNHNVHENQHTCCLPTIRVEEAHHCGCVHKDERRNSGIATCCKSQKFVDSRRYSLPSVCQENNSPCCFNNHHHNHRRSPVQEESCRHQQPFVRRHSFNHTDEENESDDEENVQQTAKSCNTPRESSPHSCSNGNLVPPSSNNKKSTNGNCSDLSSSCQNENDPLLTQKLTPEAPEARKRRLSGRKVRGLLMDLLKGCGDCRTSNPSSNMINASMYEPSTSTQHRTACSANQASCSLRANEKCPSCHNRNDKTAEIEAQLEFFRIEMEKLRSRSDTLRDMLDTLRSADIIN